MVKGKSKVTVHPCLELSPRLVVVAEGDNGLSLGGLAEGSVLVVVQIHLNDSQHGSSGSPTVDGEELVDVHLLILLSMLGSASMRVGHPGLMSTW